MINKSILIVGTYPIKNPAHGGQKRLDAIYREYKKHFTEVKYVGVFYAGFYSDYSEDDIPLSSQSEDRVRSSPLTGDIVCGEAIYKDSIVKKKFVKLMSSFKPDIVHVEQPFPYLGLKPVFADLGVSPKIIFGSQNIEAPMKEEMLAGYNVPEGIVKSTTKLIHSLEQDLSRDCDLLVACTESDLAAHKKMGAKKIVLAPNGVRTSPPKTIDTNYWCNRFGKLGVKSKVLFVGSAHPPNVVGFMDMVGKGLGFLPYDSRMVIAGSVCDFFDKEISSKNKNIEDATFWLRAFSAGRLSESRLAALIGLADVIILPITEGGGSNLKTAEAIISGKKVVATTHALRSFEWFKEFPNVWVADSASEFRVCIAEALAAAYVPLSEKQEEQSKVVLWSNCLAKLVEEAKVV